MMQWKTFVICAALFASACNLKDELVFTPPNTNGETNNTTGDAGNNNNGDMPQAGVPNVTLTNVLIDGYALPASIAPGATYEVTADLTAENSAGCAGCAIQVVVGVIGGDNNPDCLYDGPAGGPLPASVDLTAQLDEGEGELVWAAMEMADCATALAAVAETPPDHTTLGTLTFEQTGPLEVVLVSPGTDEAEVTVNSMIRVAFDGIIDPASAQGRVTLASMAGPVPANVTVNANEILIAPNAELDEFQTQYSIRVSAGITSGARSLETEFTSQFSTRMFVADRFYAAGNAFHGVGYSLAVDQANQCTVVVTDDTAPAQRFRFVPRDGGWIAYNSAPTAGGRALDAGDGTAPCSMLPLSAMPDANQIWKFIANTSTAGTFWMQNNRFNETQSLDATNNPPDGTALPLMQATTDVPRQRWRWRRLP